MRLVIDTSAIIAVLVNESTKSRLVEITRGAALLAPASVHWEVGNAFAAMFKRKRVRMSQVRKALAAYGDIPLRFIGVDLESSLELADRLKIYAYDAYVLACAQTQRCPILSLDGGLTEAAGLAGLDVVEV